MSEPTIAGLAARLAARELSAVELARDTLERIARLAPALNAFVTVDADAVTVTPAGRLFVRNVCMAFDRYLEAKREANRPVFSRTV